jgi:hypothetical protein
MKDHNQYLLLGFSNLTVVLKKQIQGQVEFERWDGELFYSEKPRLTGIISLANSNITGSFATSKETRLPENVDKSIRSQSGS